MKLRIVSWNINGLKRVITIFGSLERFLRVLNADIVCLQETQLRDGLEPELAVAPGWDSYFGFTRCRSGYSGTATFVRRDGPLPPLSAEDGFTGLWEAQRRRREEAKCRQRRRDQKREQMQDEQERDPRAEGALGAAEQGTAAAGTHATATEGQQLRPTKRQCTSVPGHEPLPSAPAQPAPLQVLQPRPTHIAHAPEGGADDAADADLHARWRTAGLGPGQLRALDGEGRVVITDHGALVLVNVYGPYVGVKRTEERMRYKIAFYRALQHRLDGFLAAGRRLVVLGDFNIAPERRDVAASYRHLYDPTRPDRAWLLRLMARGPPPSPRQLQHWAEVAAAAAAAATAAAAAAAARAAAAVQPQGHEDACHKGQAAQAKAKEAKEVAGERRGDQPDDKCSADQQARQGHGRRPSLRSRRGAGSGAEPGSSCSEDSDGDIADVQGKQLRGRSPFVPAAAPGVPGASPLAASRGTVLLPLPSPQPQQLHPAAKRQRFQPEPASASAAPGAGPCSRAGGAEAAGKVCGRGVCGLAEMLFGEAAVPPAGTCGLVVDVEAAGRAALGPARSAAWEAASAAELPAFVDVYRNFHTSTGRESCATCCGARIDLILVADGASYAGCKLAEGSAAEAEAGPALGPRTPEAGETTGVAQPTSVVTTPTVAAREAQATAATAAAGATPTAPVSVPQLAAVAAGEAVVLKGGGASCGAGGGIDGFTLPAVQLRRYTCPAWVVGTGIMPGFVDTYSDHAPIYVDVELPDSERTRRGQHSSSSGSSSNGALQQVERSTGQHRQRPPPPATGGNECCRPAAARVDVPDGPAYAGRGIAPISPWRLQVCGAPNAPRQSTPAAEGATSSRLPAPDRPAVCATSGLATGAPRAPQQQAADQAGSLLLPPIPPAARARAAAATSAAAAAALTTAAPAATACLIGLLHEPKEVAEQVAVATCAVSDAGAPSAATCRRVRPDPQRSAAPQPSTARAPLLPHSSRHLLSGGVKQWKPPIPEMPPAPAVPRAATSIRSASPPAATAGRVAALAAAVEDAKENAPAAPLAAVQQRMPPSAPLLPSVSLQAGRRSASSSAVVGVVPARVEGPHATEAAAAVAAAAAGDGAGAPCAGIVAKLSAGSGADGRRQASKAAASGPAQPAAGVAALQTPAAPVPHGVAPAEPLRQMHTHAPQPWLQQGPHAQHHHQQHHRPHHQHSHQGAQEHSRNAPCNDQGQGPRAASALPWTPSGEAAQANRHMSYGPPRHGVASAAGQIYTVGRQCTTPTAVAAAAAAAQAISAGLVTPTHAKPAAPVPPTATASVSVVTDLARQALPPGARTTPLRSSTPGKLPEPAQSLFRSVLSESVPAAVTAARMMDHTNAAPSGRPQTPSYGAAPRVRAALAAAGSPLASPRRCWSRDAAGMPRAAGGRIDFGACRKALVMALHPPAASSPHVAAAHQASSAPAPPALEPVRALARTPPAARSPATAGISRTAARSAAGWQPPRRLQCMPADGMLPECAAQPAGATTAAAPLAASRLVAALAAAASEPEARIGAAAAAAAGLGGTGTPWMVPGAKAAADATPSPADASCSGRVSSWLPAAELAPPLRGAQPAAAYDSRVESAGLPLPAGGAGRPGLASRAAPPLDAAAITSSARLSAGDLAIVMACGASCVAQEVAVPLHTADEPFCIAEVVAATKPVASQAEPPAGPPATAAAAAATASATVASLAAGAARGAAAEDSDPPLTCSFCPDSLLADGTHGASGGPVASPQRAGEPLGSCCMRNGGTAGPDRRGKPCVTADRHGLGAGGAWDGRCRGDDCPGGSRYKVQKVEEVESLAAKPGRDEQRQRKSRRRRGRRSHSWMVVMDVLAGEGQEWGAAEAAR